MTLPKATLIGVSWWRRMLVQAKAWRRRYFPTPAEMAEATLKAVYDEGTKIATAWMEARVAEVEAKKLASATRLTINEQLLKEMQSLPNIMVCKCGHPLRVHWQRPFSEDLVCTHATGPKDRCDCVISEFDILYAEDPFDPFRDPLIKDLEPSRKYKN